MNFFSKHAGNRIFLFVIPFLFMSCLPQISVKAGSNDEATILFSTGFSDAAAKTLKAMNGESTETPLFNKNDVMKLLKDAGAVNTSVTIPGPTEITAAGTIPDLSKNQLSKTGILTKNEKSLTLTIGTKQINAFYELLNDEAKAYLDLMMIPALLGEKMTVAEYKDLLASMYGPTFAEEIAGGTLTITLSSPDGRKKTKESIKLGELLTTTEEKSWTVKF